MLSEEETWEVHRRVVQLYREGNTSPGEGLFVISTVDAGNNRDYVIIREDGSAWSLFVAPVITDKVSDLKFPSRGKEEGTLARLRRVMVLGDLANS